MEALKLEPVPPPHEPRAKAHSTRAYRNLLFMVEVHFVLMYALMYLMVDTSGDLFLNANNVYMAGAMAAPMAPLMLWLMRDMYPNRRLNLGISLISLAALAACILFTREQAFVGNEQFVRSMVPHHSGAILMCRQAKITDPELISLCGQIERGQRREIEQMKGVLERIGR